MTWIENNKDWFLSGAGIYIVGSIVSIISIIGTIISKNISDKRKRKKLSLELKLTKLSLTQNNDKNNISDNINVSYKNKEYKNLCYMKIDIENTGSISIENQSVLITFPKETIFIEKYQEFGNSTIEIFGETEKEIENRIEVLKKINRLEPNDRLTLVYLINVNNEEQIKIQPRGVDDLDCSYRSSFKTSIENYEKISLAIATYLVFDSIPIIGNYFKALVVLVIFPTIKNIIIKLYQQKKQCNNITIENNGSLKLEIDNNKV